MSGRGETNGGWENNTFSQSPVAVNGKQVINYYAPGPTGPAPRRRTTKDVCRDALSARLRSAWFMCGFCWALGVSCYVTVIPQLPATLETHVQAWTPWLLLFVLATFGLDALGFVLRYRWDRRGRYWLSHCHPLLTHDILPRVGLITVLAVLPYLVSQHQPPTL